MADLILDHLGKIVILLAVSLVLLIVWVDRRHDRKCEAILQMARTSSDSIAVMLRCELGSGNTTVVPVYAPRP